MAVTGPGSHIQASQFADPCRVADVTVAVAVRASQVLTTVAVDAPLGSAGIARLAFLANIDLAAVHASSAVLPVRPGVRAPDEIHQVTGDPWTEAASLGLSGFNPALETP